MRPMTRSLLTAGLLLALASCTRTPETPDPATDAASTAPADAATMQQAPVDAMLREGPEPTLRRLAPLDYVLHYKLMQATGMESALGGEAAAIAALQALGDAYERELRGDDGQLPRLQPVAFNGEGMDFGLLGVSFAVVPTMWSGLGVTGHLGNWDDAKLQEAIAKGEMPLDGNGGPPGSPMVQYTQGDATVTLTMEVKEGDVSGKVRVKLRMDTCPDANGRITVDVEVKSDMALAGSAGSGGSVTANMRFERHIDDDARLIDSHPNDQSTGHMTIHGSQGSGGRSMLDLTLGGGGPPTVNDRSRIGLFDGAEARRVAEHAQATQDFMAGVVRSILTGIEGKAGKAPWESGHCVKLDATSNPSRRKHAKPGTTFEIEAKPRARADGAPTGGTVRATLSGNRQLTPATGKIPADAKYSYAGPDKKDESASIEFEARSKRGVGRATLEFDTKQGAHRVSGGQNDFQADHTVCALDAPFDIRSSVGLTMHLVPAGDNGGAWTQSGNAGGVSWSGGGNYSLSLDDNGNGTLKASGTSIIATPLGRFSDAVEPEFSITQAEGESCD